MKRLLLISLFAPLSVFASQSDYNYYFNLGAGAAFPGRDSSTTADSSSVLYGPTSAPSGSSLFYLSNVDWQNDYQTGFELNAVIGQYFSESWRLEGEFLYQRFSRNISGSYDWIEIDAGSGDQFNRSNGKPISHADSPVDLYTLMANVLYDFNTNTRWTPFLGLGIGVSYMDSQGTKKAGTLRIDTNIPPLDIEAPTVEKSPDLYGTAFAWQVKLGVSYDFMDRMSLGLAYRLLGTTKFKAGESKIITNPDTSNEEAVFKVGEQDIQGLLNHSVNLSWGYKF